MSRRWVILLVVLLPGGCKDQDKMRWNWFARKDEPPPAAPAVQEPTPEQREIAQLKEEVRALTERLGEVQGRGKLLAEKARTLEQDNTQLRAQLRAIGDAARQRDEHKARCTLLEQQAAKLRKHIEALEAQIVHLPSPVAGGGATTMPASQPAGG